MDSLSPSAASADPQLRSPLSLASMRNRSPLLRSSERTSALGLILLVGGFEFAWSPLFLRKGFHDDQVSPEKSEGLAVYLGAMGGLSAGGVPSRLLARLISGSLYGREIFKEGERLGNLKCRDPEVTRSVEKGLGGSFFWQRSRVFDLVKISDRCVLA
ncbi:hypothetical protein Bca4012_015910 [Brassica carinata]